MKPQRESVITSVPIPVENLAGLILCLGSAIEEVHIIYEDGEEFNFDTRLHGERLCLRGHLDSIQHCFDKPKSVKTVEDRNDKTLRIFL